TDTLKYNIIKKLAKKAVIGQRPRHHLLSLLLRVNYTGEHLIANLLRRVSAFLGGVTSGRGVNTFVDPHRSIERFPQIGPKIVRATAFLFRGVPFSFAAVRIEAARDPTALASFRKASLIDSGGSAQSSKPTFTSRGVKSDPANPPTSLTPPSPETLTLTLTLTKLQELTGYFHLCPSCSVC
ncbi:hypothetical protein U1Q18_027962, partial [Sarracenia purpurea var. burkii]